MRDFNKNRAGRDLQPGDQAWTDYEDINGTRHKLVTITARREEKGCQSGILYQVKPRLRPGSRNSWYDADWFIPARRKTDEEEI
jgi:hypothetical protein